MNRSTAISPRLNIRNPNLIANMLTTTTSFWRNLPQILAVVVKNVMLIGFGMTLGFPTVLIGGLEDSTSDFSITQDELSWISAINLIFVPIGCLLSGPYSEKFGRRRAMQMANVPLALAWIIFRYSTEVWHLYVGLAIIGTLLGVIEAPVVTYVSEVTTPNLRGLLFSTSTLFTIIGTLASFFLGTIYYWRSVAQIALLVPVISINLLFFIPESPYWLIRRNRNEDAQAALAWLRGWVCREDSEIQKEFESIKAFIDNTANIGAKLKPSCINYTSKSFLKPYFLVVFVFYLRHFSGITNVQTYAVEIFHHIHAPMDKYKATTFMGVFELFGCITCISLIRFLGKRKLLFVTMMLSMLSLSSIPIYSYGSLGKEHKWIPMCGLFAYCYFQHCCLRTLPWILIGEVFTPETRSIASGLSAASGYLFGFFANKMYYTFVKTFTLNGVFIMYMISLLIGGCVLYCIMPETEGKSLEEICAYYASSKKASCNDTERVERNNNKDLKEYESTCEDRSECNNYNEQTFKYENVEGNNYPTYTIRTMRRMSSYDEYMINLDRLGTSTTGPNSYKKFDILSDI